MSPALKQAREAFAEGEVPIGAVVIKEGLVIGTGRNRREQLADPTSHAEIEALRAASAHLGDWRLTGCDLYVTLEPCMMCLGALWQSRIDRVVFGACDPKGGARSLGYDFSADPKLNHRFELIHELNEECSLILTEFFRGPRPPKPKPTRR